MAADPRWLEILKASGGQAFALSGACGAILLAAHLEWIPPLEPWMVQAAVFAFCPWDAPVASERRKCCEQALRSERMVLALVLFAPKKVAGAKLYPAHDPTRKADHRISLISQSKNVHWRR